MSASDERTDRTEGPFADRLRAALGGQYHDLSTLYRQVAEAWGCRSDAAPTVGPASEELGYEEKSLGAFRRLQAGG